MYMRKQFDVVTPDEGDSARLKGELVLIDKETSASYHIVNPEDRWYGDHLFAIAIGPISGWHGVYASNMQDALDILADWCEDNAPGLVDSYDNLLKEYGYDEQAVIDFNTGPVGNHGVYFTEGEIHFAKVQDNRVPSIPDDIFPIATIHPTSLILDRQFNNTTPRQYMIEYALQYIRAKIYARYRDKVWCEPLCDYLTNNADTVLDIGIEVVCNGKEFKVWVNKADD